MRPTDNKRSNLRATSIHELTTTKWEVLPLEGEWRDLVGQPECNGCWIVYGGTGCGKTNFSLQLARTLMAYSKVIYDSMEEGASASLVRSIRQAGITGSRIQIGDRWELSELTEVLHRHKSANIIFIDTIQFMTITAWEFKDLLKLFPKKLFVVVSHLKNNKHEGVGDAVSKIASVKIQVGNNGTAYIRSSRYGSNKQEYIFYEKKRREVDGL